MQWTWRRHVIFPLRLALTCNILLSKQSTSLEALCGLHRLALRREVRTHTWLCIEKCAMRLRSIEYLRSAIALALNDVPVPVHAFFYGRPRLYSKLIKVGPVAHSRRCCILMNIRVRISNMIAPNFFLGLMPFSITKNTMRGAQRHTIPTRSKKTKI